jgi:hypothetical protein
MINEILSLFHIQGEFICPQSNGIDSLKLKGAFKISLRHFSGVFLAPDFLNTFSPEARHITEDFFDFLKSNNPFYQEHATQPMMENPEMYAFHVAEKELLFPHNIYGTEIQRLIAHPEGRTIRLITKDKAEKSLNVSFERALALLFPTLFPFVHYPRFLLRHSGRRPKLCFVLILGFALVLLLAISFSGLLTRFCDGKIPLPNCGMAKRTWLFLKVPQTRASSSHW